MRIKEIIKEATWQDIYNLNRDILSSPNSIKTGMELIMPDNSHYQVAQGDNLSLIAAGKGRGRTVWNSRGEYQQAQPKFPRTPTPTSNEPVGRSGPHPVAGKVAPTVAPVTAATGTGPIDIGNGVLVDPDMDPADIDALQTTKASAWPGEMWKVINGKFETVPVIPGKPRPYVAADKTSDTSPPATRSIAPTPQFTTPGAAHDGQQGQDVKNWNPEAIEQMRQDQIARIKQLAGTD